MAEQRTNQLSPYEQAKLYRQQLAQEKNEASNDRQKGVGDDIKNQEAPYGDLKNEPDRVADEHLAQTELIRARKQEIVKKMKAVAGRAVKQQAVKRVKRALIKWLVSTILPALAAALPWILLILLIIIVLLVTIYYYCDLVNSFHLNWLLKYFTIDCSA